MSSSSNPIYLDYNGTTPIDSRVADAMQPFLYEHFGNPSSSHFYGLASKNALQKARGQVASLLGCKPSEVIFTSGGTESNNISIHGVARRFRDKGKHIITSSIEHPAVLEPCAFLEKEGYTITKVGVDATGRVNVSAIQEAITPETILISVMHANNEVGTIQPIAEIAELAHEHDIIVHCDAAQSIGKVPVKVQELQVDLLTIAGHKLYASKGIGALYIREGLELPVMMQGAPQESGRRPGTENILQIVGLGEAAELCSSSLDEEGSRIKKLRDTLQANLKEQLGENIRINGHPEYRLPNTLHVGFAGVNASDLLSSVKDSLAASAGAACHADQVSISHVLRAMAIPEHYAKGAVRLSLGRMTTSEEVNSAGKILCDTYLRLSNG